MVLTHIIEEEGLIWSSDSTQVAYRNNACCAGYKVMLWLALWSWFVKTINVQNRMA